MVYRCILQKEALFHFSWKCKVLEERFVFICRMEQCLIVSFCLSVYCANWLFLPFFCALLSSPSPTHLPFITHQPSVLLNFLFLIVLWLPLYHFVIPLPSSLCLLRADTRRLRRLFPRLDRRRLQLSVLWAQPSAGDWATWGTVQQSQNALCFGKATRTN